MTKKGAGVDKFLPLKPTFHPFDRDYLENGLSEHFVSTET